MAEPWVREGALEGGGGQMDPHCCPRPKGHVPKLNHKQHSKPTGTPSGPTAVT